jgi:hypothetical protein
MAKKSVSLKTIDQRINSIGNKVINCPKQCVGVTNNSGAGIVPRCIFFDFTDAKSMNGCIIVGINPGRMKIGGPENLHYLRNRKNLSYKTIVDIWSDPPKVHSYYKFLKNFSELIGLNGPILWTELVKCEMAKSNIVIPLQTFRTCVNMYLVKEIKHIPPAWPVIAVGREAFKALSYIFPARSILGVPHPASKGNFTRLYKPKKFGNQLKTIVYHKINNHFSSPNGVLWLSS